MVNIVHMKAVADRKTDVRTRNGLREPVRYHRNLIQEKTRELNRIQIVLDGSNINWLPLTNVIQKLGKGHL